MALMLLASAAHSYVVLTPGSSCIRSSYSSSSSSRRCDAAEMVSRRTAEMQKQVDYEKLYTPAEACALMKKCATAKFVETAELHGNLNLDPKYNDQQIRTTVSLPHGTGNDVRVAVLAEGPAADAAKAAGADLVGFDDLIEDIAGGALDFDVLLATPPAMPKLAKLGKVLGPKGLMPSPKAGTVSADPAGAVAEFKAGKLEFRTDKQGIVHVPFGKVRNALPQPTTCPLPPPSPRALSTSPLPSLFSHSPLHSLLALPSADLTSRSSRRTFSPWSRPLRRRAPPAARASCGTRPPSPRRWARRSSLTSASSGRPSPPKPALGVGGRAAWCDDARCAFVGLAPRRLPLGGGTRAEKLARGSV